MAEVDTRVETLEDEVKVLKGEVRRTLVDLRALLMREDSPISDGSFGRRATLMEADGGEPPVVTKKEISNMVRNETREPVATATQEAPAQVPPPAPNPVPQPPASAAPALVAPPPAPTPPPPPPTPAPVGNSGPAYPQAPPPSSPPTDYAAAERDRAMADQQRRMDEQERRLEEQDRQRKMDEQDRQRRMEDQERRLAEQERRIVEASATQVSRGAGEDAREEQTSRETMRLTTRRRRGEQQTPEPEWDDEPQTLPSRADRSQRAEDDEIDHNTTAPVSSPPPASSGPGRNRDHKNFDPREEDEVRDLGKSVRSDDYWEEDFSGPDDNGRGSDRSGEQQLHRGKRPWAKVKEEAPEEPPHAARFRLRPSSQDETRGPTSGREYSGDEREYSPTIKRNGRNSRVYEEYIDLLAETEALVAEEESGGSSLLLDVNLLSSLTHWVAIARQRVGEKRLNDILDLYSKSGHLSQDVRELIHQIAGMIDDVPSEAVVDGQECVDLIFHLHGILAGGLTIRRVPATKLAS